MKIKKIYESESADWWNELNEEERQEINQGIKEADQGLGVDHRSIMKHFDEWK